MAVHFHEEDLAADVRFADGPIAVDTEAMGLNPHRQYHRSPFDYVMVAGAVIACVGLLAWAFFG